MYVRLDDKDFEVRFLKSCTGPEPSFEEKDKLFTKYKIVNWVHNQWKVYYENKDKKAAPPHMKKPPTNNGREEIRKDAKDIPWCNLNQVEKGDVKMRGWPFP